MDKKKLYIALMASLAVFSENAESNESNVLKLSEVNGRNGFKIKGFPDAQVGVSVSGAGDINNDGNPDLVVGTGTQIGKSYVLYGGQTFSHPFDLSELNGQNGFEIINAAGALVSPAGDFNADGIDDLMIGNGPTIQVIFGRKTSFPAVVDAKLLSESEGLSILGIEEEPSSYRVEKSVNRAGDVNGDGFDDVILGSPRSEETYESCEYSGYSGYSGSGYVLFGGDQLAGAIDVTDLTESEGTKFVGNEHFSTLGISAAGVGDLNGDGFQDFALSREGDYWYYYAYCLDSYYSETYVIFGSNESELSEVTVDTLNGSNGFIISDNSRWNHDYPTVSAAGDVNGDGLDDMSFCNKSYCSIVFGRITPFETRLRIDSNNNSDRAVKFTGSQRRISVQPLKDFNGDGIDDYLHSAEKLAVVYGREDGFQLVNDVLQMTANEVFFVESSTHEMSQFSGIGDFNQDGLSDFILGQPDAFGGRGTSYVIYGVRDLIFKSNFEE